MSLKGTKAKLERLEKLLNEANYVLRFEKGNFNSGYCILEHRRVVVINKFLDPEGRINVLTDLLLNLEIEKDRLSSESRKCYDMLVREAENSGLLHQVVEQEITSNKKQKP